MLPLALVGVVGLVVAALKLSGQNLKAVAAGLHMPLAYVESAAKWSRKRGLPLNWTLTTILVESAGNPRAVGDGGKSLGLMQVNASAHATELQRAGVPREQLLLPDVGIEWGTKYLAEFKAQVLDALGGRTPPAPLDEIVRLAYKGPAPVYSALRRGQNPVAVLSWAPDAVLNWRRRMQEVLTAEARGKAAPRVS